MLRKSYIFLILLFLVCSSGSALEISPLSLNTAPGQISQTTFTVRASQPVFVSTNSPIVLIDSPQLPNGTTQVTITTDLTGIGPGDPDVLGYIIFTESPPDAQVSVSISNAIQLSIKNPGGSINNAPTQPKDQPTEKIQTLTPEITPVPVSSHEQGIYGLSIGLITGIILVLGGIFLSVGVIWKYILH